MERDDDDDMMERDAGGGAHAAGRLLLGYMPLSHHGVFVCAACFINSRNEGFNIMW